MDPPALSATAANACYAALRGGQLVCPWMGRGGDATPAGQGPSPAKSLARQGPRTRGRRTTRLRISQALKRFPTGSRPRGVGMWTRDRAAAPSSSTGSQATGAGAAKGRSDSRRSVEPGPASAEQRRAVHFARGGLGATALIGSHRAMQTPFVVSFDRPDPSAKLAKPRGGGRCLGAPARKQLVD